MALQFAHRSVAGRALATKLVAHAHRAGVLLFALPRRGVPVASRVARVLHAPLDVCVVRKLGVPGHEELAMGAIAMGGVRVLNKEVAVYMDEAVIDAVSRQEQAELQRRERLYRGDRPAPNIQGRAVILVDDGLATGSTMRAAAVALRQMQPHKIVVAVPVAAAETCDEFRSEVDEVVCAATPEPFMAVGLWYADFSQTSDEEVRELLEQAAREHQQDAEIRP